MGANNQSWNKEGGAWGTCALRHLFPCHVTCHTTGRGKETLPLLQAALSAICEYMEEGANPLLIRPSPPSLTLGSHLFCRNVRTIIIATHKNTQALILNGTPYASRTCMLFPSSACAKTHGRKVPCVLLWYNCKKGHALLLCIFHA